MREAIERGDDIYLALRHMYYLVTFLCVSFLVFILSYLFGIELGTVWGDSMLPALRSGDVVVVQKIPSRFAYGNEVKIGDIVLAVVTEENKGVYYYSVVKRVVCILPPHTAEGQWESYPHLTLILCGDNRKVSAHYRVIPSQIRGKCIAIIRREVVVAALLIILLYCLSRNVFKKKGGEENASA